MRLYKMLFMFSGLMLLGSLVSYGSYDAPTAEKPSHSVSISIDYDFSFEVAVDNDIAYFHACTIENLSVGSAPDLHILKPSVIDIGTYCGLIPFIEEGNKLWYLNKYKLTEASTNLSTTVHRSIG